MKVSKDQFEFAETMLNNFDPIRVKQKELKEAKAKEDALKSTL